MPILTTSRPVWRAAALLLPLLGASLGTAQARTLAEAKASGTLNAATSGDFRPFNFLDASGRPDGFEVELIGAVAAKMGLKVNWQVRPFDGLLEDVNSDRYGIDVVAASHAITSTRLKTVEFSNPHYCTGGVILARQGGPQTSRALSGRTMAAEEGSTYLGFLKKLPFGKSISVLPTGKDVVRAVALGRADAAVTDRFVALEALTLYPKANLIVSDMLWKETVGLAVARENGAMRQALNVALKAVIDDGTYARLSQKYFGQNIRC
ncbi:ABC transporter substrate-binding protein [Deinococcus knuensis]|uniref:Amino acid ABC transporter substrate-binding protein n=1 Tax=Deinococcus knuensis TaxID=1837380 RepID=A0ABQ2SDB7_9DEIO|nr:ABC transporter substrate-binding protein [Deinococcus knuensis]GGS19839.1 amino acid ABC transporter substrate-binding protein [Deinococcus knuensis]